MPGSAILPPSASTRTVRPRARDGAQRRCLCLRPLCLSPVPAGEYHERHLPEMVERSLQSGFGITKETALPRWCRECEVLAACRGGCPKHRLCKTYDGEPGLHYLCPGYKKFFRHIRKYLSAMTQLLENGLPRLRSWRPSRDRW